MKRLVVPLALVLAGCASGLRIDETYTSANQDSRVQFIVIHFTNEGWASSLKTLTEPSERSVSSHYLVRDDPPRVHRLVDEGRRAWHAGVSSWRRTTALNASSIGIEIVNGGEMGSPYAGVPIGELVFAEYPKAQVDAVVDLVKDIARRHQVRPENIVGHSDIAPQRKVDPGPKFPWKRLADEGLIAWPDAGLVAQRRAAYEQALPDIAWFQDKLHRHGFEVPRHGELDAATRRVLAVFQMKYRPERYDGTPDAHTAAILDALVGQ
jgi:N-acetylmuramoyl-L-alanine amidase